MKIYLANSSKQKIGGGWTFLNNLYNGLKDKVDFVNNWQDCDIYFISGATMVERDEVKAVKEAGKKKILRVDNIPRNSRNRNTGTSRLYDFAQLADKVIYQSRWAKEYVGYFIQKDGPIIYNGVDTKIFNPQGEKLPRTKNNVYLYVQYNRDENKRMPEAFMYFHWYWRKNKDSELWLMGRFSPDLIKYNFDFFMNEPVRYLGVREYPHDVAKVMRSVDILLIPYFCDACSNTLLEGIASGCKIDFCLSGLTGGAKELIELSDISLERMCNEYLKVFKELCEKDK